MSESDPLAAFGVSRETRALLETYVAELRRWQRVTNLVGPATLQQVWSRHIADSLQLSGLAAGRTWVDLGTGAGLPGLIIALADPGRLVHLVESDARKCAFLHEVVRRTGASATIHRGRIETIIDGLDPRPAVVTARALAPLSILLGFSETLLRTGAIGLFPKGRDSADELTEARKSWRFSVDILPSQTDSAARILRVYDLARVGEG